METFPDRGSPLHLPALTRMHALQDERPCSPKRRSIHCTRFGRSRPGGMGSLLWGTSNLLQHRNVCNPIADHSNIPACASAIACYLIAPVRLDV